MKLSGIGAIAIGLAVAAGAAVGSQSLPSLLRHRDKAVSESEIKQTQIPLSELTNDAPAIDKYSSDGLTLTVDEAYKYLREVYDEDKNNRFSTWEAEPVKVMIGHISGRGAYIFYDTRKIVRPENLETTVTNLQTAFHRIVDEERAQENLLIKDIKPSR